MSEKEAKEAWLKTVYKFIDIALVPANAYMWHVRCGLCDLHDDLYDATSYKDRCKNCPAFPKICNKGVADDETVYGRGSTALEANDSEELVQCALEVLEWLHDYGKTEGFSSI